MGYLEWVTQVLPYGRPYAAALWDIVPKHFGNDWTVTITDESRGALQWWHTFLSSAVQGRIEGWASLWPGGWPPVVRMYSDSSGTIGFGAICEGDAVVGAWHPEVADDYSSAFKELVPVFYALRRVAPRLAPGSIVVVTTDNASNAFDLNFGSSCPESRPLFLEIWNLAARHHLHLVGDWFSRDRITLLDSMSRLANFASFRVLWGAAPSGRWRA